MLFNVAKAAITGKARHPGNNTLNQQRRLNQHVNQEQQGKVRQQGKFTIHPPSATAQSTRWGMLGS